MGRTASQKQGWGPRVQPLTPSLNGLRLNITSLYGLWVEAVEEPPGVPEAWHEGKSENDPARMQLALRFNLSEALPNGMPLTANANGVTCLLARCEA